ncbi:alpha/beta fold hydrolase [Novosphingobium album (ex Liu et al. 2023)]|uniref:Alpha/beta hydrolase n=1 Tax=Novosphingobium album (ex Liu et al. 2023) TaxID=3031130 RepID=A0ABT5WQI5_9SPHN|nr:alpha/beta hydrolase [Novosphingobium album (ex Liu et al. 2023)]MDE8651253.1 alpha/beta hydrolase [Novosphingobium album (ex Liu et al. 2023)]
MKLLYRHGWGFDAGFWAPLAALLPEWPALIDDRGYFGKPAAPAVDGPCLAVTHSFGTMRLLRDPPPGLRALVAINGFDRFTAREGRPGLPARVVDRMIARFASDPAAVLAEFRERCGCSEPAGRFDAALLHRDLLALRDEDACDAAGRLGVPILSLQAARDAILPEAPRQAVFATAPALTRLTHPGAGHLLPWQDPRWCADAIRDLIGRLA